MPPRRRQRSRLNRRNPRVRIWLGACSPLAACLLLAWLSVQAQAGRSNLLVPSNQAPCAVPPSDIPPGTVGPGALAPLRRTAQRSQRSQRSGSATAPLPLPLAADPLSSSAMSAFLGTRGGVVTAAVDDLVTGQLWVYNPGGRGVTASIIKLDILETLLRQSELSHVRFDGASPSVIQGMIENSDNDDATTLWDHVGGPGAIAAFNASAGLTQTSPNVAWGLTSTSAVDQIRLLCQLVLAHGLLNGGAQGYALGLMEHIETDQDWGVSGDVPAGVSVALKNGWLPHGDGWEINSVGRVQGDGRDYLIAVLTANDPGEGYGIATIEGLSSRVWAALQPAP
ncbi:MAG: serine hydrolase [Solirubrobacteraceae bacterium]